MPGAGGRDHLKPATKAPKPKKPKDYHPPEKPDADMYDFNSPTPKKEKKKKSKKKGRGRVTLQVDRTFTPKEWQTIARSMDDRRRPYAPRPVDPRKYGRFGGRGRPLRRGQMMSRFRR